MPRLGITIHHGFSCPIKPALATHLLPLSLPLSVCLSVFIHCTRGRRLASFDNLIETQSEKSLGVLDLEVGLAQGRPACVKHDA